MPKIVGDYKIIKTLGDGNFSKVKKVLNIKNNKYYSMKIINISDLKNNLMKKQIHKRINSMSEMNHPGIIKLKRIMHSKNNIFLVFNLEEGELFNSLAQNGPLPEDTARHYFQQLIDILSYIHDEGSSFRDLKAENLLVDSEGNLKVTDFICSNMTKNDNKTNDKSESENSQIIQLRFYSSPESLHEKGYVSPAADIWSAGVLLYFMLTGELPFEGSTEEEVENNINNCNPKYPPKFPKKVQSLLQTIFVKDPACRITIPELKKNGWFAHDYKPVIGQKREKKIEDIEVTVHYTADTKTRHSITVGDEDDNCNAFELIGKMSGVSIDRLVNPSVPVKSMTSFTSPKNVDELLDKTNKVLLHLAARIKDRKNPNEIKTIIPICSKEIYLRIEFTKVTNQLTLVDIKRIRGKQTDFLRIFKILKSELS